MVHTAVGYARQKDRLQTWAVTASIGPGSTNMLTGAALATINRLPVLLLPSDTFATRVSAPVLQELELTRTTATSRVNDAFKPLSRYFDRVWRPEQLPAALLGAMRVLTDPVETGQRRWPSRRTCRPRRSTGRNRCSPNAPGTSPARCRNGSVIARAAEMIRARRAAADRGGRRRDLLRGHRRAAAHSSRRPASRWDETQAGKGSLPYDHPQSVGAIGSTGTTAANALAAEADVVIGIGTRYSDFTSASRTAFNNPDVRFVNINVASFDSGQAGWRLRGRRRPRGHRGADGARSATTRSATNTARARRTGAEWDDTVSAAYRVEDDGSR